MTEPSRNSGIFVRSKRVVPALSRRLSERVNRQWVQSAEGSGLVDKAEQLRTNLAEGGLRLLANEWLVVGNEVRLATSDARPERRVRRGRCCWSWSRCWVDGRRWRRDIVTFAGA